ncbi:MAG: type II toxin-antitoxin system VapC family toxin [Bacteroidales bacterium]|jgi:PIN domain nuclease of toxin-antitoxin system|nr:type II toxin-antitoxin system VapC family toxin [Bacteroidales bacterium]
MKRDRFMLDTNIILGMILKDKYFSKEIRNIIDFNSAHVSVSVEVLKEISYLKHNGRVDIKMNFEQFMDFFNNKGFEVLPFNQYAAKKYDELPLFENHKDPFDRAIIAHTIANHSTLISTDGKFKKYRRYGLDLVEV